jgi:hypothetical protein
MITPLKGSTDRALGFTISGKLHDEDYQRFIPVVETAIQTQGKIRILAKFEDFHGWDLHALWDDTKFATKHCADVERVAIVGDKQWEKWMTAICKPFTLATIRYFDASEIDAGWTWLREGLA